VAVLAELMEVLSSRKLMLTKMVPSIAKNSPASSVVQLEVLVVLVLELVPVLVLTVVLVVHTHPTNQAASHQLVELVDSVELLVVTVLMLVLPVLLAVSHHTNQAVFQPEVTSVLVLLSEQV